MNNPSTNSSLFEAQSLKNSYLTFTLVLGLALQIWCSYAAYRAFISTKPFVMVLEPADEMLNTETIVIAPKTKK